MITQFEISDGKVPSVVSEVCQVYGVVHQIYANRGGEAASEPALIINTIRQAATLAAAQRIGN
jgi:hypothetical protein